MNRQDRRIGKKKLTFEEMLSLEKKKFLIEVGFNIHKKRIRNENKKNSC